MQQVEARCSSMLLLFLAFHCRYRGASKQDGFPQRRTLVVVWLSGLPFRWSLVLEITSVLVRGSSFPASSPVLSVYSKSNGILRCQLDRWVELQQVWYNPDMETFEFRELLSSPMALSSLGLSGEGLWTILCVLAEFKAYFDSLQVYHCI